MFEIIIFCWRTRSQRQELGNNKSLDWQESAPARCMRRIQTSEVVRTDMSKREAAQDMISGCLHDCLVLWPDRQGNDTRWSIP